MFLTHAHVCVHTLYYDYPLKRSQNYIYINILIFNILMHIYLINNYIYICMPVRKEALIIFLNTYYIL